jgi:hypothetical protein
MLFNDQNTILQTLCLALFVGVIVFGFVAFVLKLPPFKQPADRREVQRGADGKIVAVGERVRRSSFTLKGTGTVASDTRLLDEGMYKAMYHFPDGVLTAVHLISVDDGDKELLFVKAGEGTAAVHVPRFGRYVVQVEPADSVAAWTIDIMPLGFQ